MMCLEKKKIIMVIYIYYFFLYVVLNVCGQNIPFVQMGSKVVACAFVFALCGCSLGKCSKLNLTWLDIAMFFSGVYLFCSLLFSCLFYDYSLNFFVKEFFYAIFPFFFYWWFRWERICDYSYLWNLTVGLFAIAIALGYMVYFGLDGGYGVLLNLKTGYSDYKLSSVYGIIGTAFLGQLVYSIMLFKRNKNIKDVIFLLWIALSVLLIGQKGGLVGLVVGSLFFLVDCIREGTVKISNKCIMRAGIVFFVGVVICFCCYDFVYVTVERIYNILLYKINLTTLLERANDQQIITDKSFFMWILGEGLGVHSFSNEQAVLIQSDACYYRILNELGILGGIVFFCPFMLAILQAIRIKNIFGCYFVLETLLAFFFNRILWMVPINFIVFIYLAMICNNYVKANVVVKHFCNTTT